MRFILNTKLQLCVINPEVFEDECKNEDWLNCWVFYLLFLQICNFF